MNTIFELDAYEITNLRAGLLTLRALNLDTGDWLGQILNRLPETTLHPNRAIEDQVAEATQRIIQEHRP